MSKRSYFLALTALSVCLVILIGATVSAVNATAKRPELITPPLVSTRPLITPEPTSTPSGEIVNTPKPEWVCPLTDEEVELIALLTMAEAEGEPEEGQRLVIDTVLNRVDSPHFPDTVYDVVYQKNQYSSMWGDRVTRCYVKEELCELVREETKERTNYEVVFFRTKHYHSFGVPMFQVGNHYFSKYE